VLNRIIVNDFRISHPRSALSNLRSAFAILLLAILAAGNGFAGPPSPQAVKADLTVSAAISLKDALDDVRKL
jgi:ABC-type molybdate transport system substrate-binding protein